MSRPHRASVLWIATLLVFISVSPPQARAQQEIIAEFQAGSLMKMVIYTQEEHDDVTHYTIAHLLIKNGSRRNIFAFNLGEWEHLIMLCREAATAQYRDWTIVGSMTETGTSEASHLTVSAGPGIRFVIGSVRYGAPLAYDLSSFEMGRFEQALYTVEASLSR